MSMLTVYKINTRKVPLNMDKNFKSKWGEHSETSESLVWQRKREREREQLTRIVFVKLAPIQLCEIILDLHYWLRARVSAFTPSPTPPCSLNFTKVLWGTFTNSRAVVARFKLEFSKLYQVLQCLKKQLFFFFIS